LNTPYDIVITGGGMVGHALRIACTQLGFSVCFVDPKPQVHSSSSDGRAMALSYSSVQLLRQLGVWDALSSHATPIERVQVSAAGRLGTMSCCARDIDLEYLGQIVPAHVLGSTLVGAQHAAPLICPMPARLQLVCDGTDSPTRDALHIPFIEKSAIKSALVTNVSINKPHANTAYQRLIPGGVCALLPLHDHKMTIVFSMNNEHISELNALDDATLSQKINDLWGGRFGSMSVSGPRFMYPLREVYVKNPVKDRVILMGNASHTLNPIAAQGLNLAFRDIAVLIDILKDAKALGVDLGEYVPPIFLSRAQPTHQRMQQVTDVLVNASYARYLSPFQGFGLSVLQHVPFVKQQCAKMFAF
jgi:2-octaprenyl-6-methoxyphenol hydroxylase